MAVGGMRRAQKPIRPLIDSGCERPVWDAQVIVAEPTVPDSISILRGIKPKYYPPASPGALSSCACTLASLHPR